MFRDVMDATCIRGTYAHVWMSRPRTHSFKAARQGAFKRRVGGLSGQVLPPTWVLVGMQTSLALLFLAGPGKLQKFFLNERFPVANQLPCLRCSRSVLPTLPPPTHLADLSQLGTHVAVSRMS